MRGEGGDNEYFKMAKPEEISPIKCNQCKYNCFIVKDLNGGPSNDGNEPKKDISKYIKPVEKWASLHSEFSQIAMPLIKTGSSLMSDMKFGWRP